MSLYEASVPQLKKMLQNLDKWLDAAEARAKEKSFDTSVLVNARLAADQYPFVRQVQAACDAAKFAAARVAGKTPPAHPDTEKTFEELHTRVRAVVSYLETLTKADFEGAKDRVVPLSFMPGKGLSASDYLNEMALPNFYFHVTLAYEILRHNGVELGKISYIGSLNLKDI